ncbi:MAG: hypothetical protein AABY13_03730, partial [Nanoarchaeota archaeon]
KRASMFAQPNEQPARQAGYTMDALGNQFVTPNTAQNAQLRHGVQIGEPLLEYAAIDLKTGTLKEAFKTEAMHTVKGAKFAENRKNPGYLTAKVTLDKSVKGTTPRTVKFVTEPAVPPADGVTYPAGYQLQSTYKSSFKESIALRNVFADGSGFLPLSRYTMEYASPLRNDATDVQLDALAPVPITDVMFAGDPVSATDVAFRRYDMVNQVEKGDLESTIVRAAAKKIGKLPNGTRPNISGLSNLYVRRTLVPGTQQLPSTPQYIFEVGIKVLPEFIDSTGVARPVIVKGTSFEEVIQYTAKR